MPRKGFRNITEKDIAKQKDAIARDVKVLFIDLENSPILGFSWDSYEATLLDVVEDSKILCFSYKWQHETKIHNVSLLDFPYKPNRFKIDDSKVVAELWGLFNEADIIIAQNGDRFDVRVANARFLAHGLPPPSPYQTIDTLKIARRYFKLAFNSLDHLCRFLKIERKVDAGGIHTWWKCMDGDPKAWKHMIYYCNADVDRLVKVYNKMKGWHKNHPNVSLYTRRDDACPRCQSTNSQLNGKRLVAGGWKQEYMCNDCGGYWRGVFIKYDGMRVDTKPA